MSKNKKSNTKVTLNRGARPVIVLIVVCIVCTALLSFTNGVTANARQAQRIKKIKENRQLLFPEASDFDEQNIDQITFTGGNLLAFATAIDSKGQTLGWIAETNAPGYGGLVNVMVGIEPSGKLVGIRILDNQETAGLGKKVENDNFRTQFKDLSATERYTAGNNADKIKIDAVSGATISSNAVSNAVNTACDAWQQLAGGGQ